MRTFWVVVVGRRLAACVFGEIKNKKGLFVFEFSG